MKNKLDFVIVGPQRTGSSWLDRALRDHPGIAMPKLSKETFFFDDPDKGALADYFDRYFADISADCKAGEAGPTYFHNPAARDRLRKAFPELKIIILLRDPVERTFSLFRHEVAKGRSEDDLAQAIAANPEIIESGRYATHIPLCHAEFGQKNVLLVNFKDIEGRPEELIREIQRFIGVPERSLSPDLLEKYGAGHIPRVQKIATMAAAASRGLRRAGFDRIVEWAKSLGLKDRIFAGGDASRMEISDDDRRILEKAHAEDIDYIRQLEKEQTWSS